MDFNAFFRDLFAEISFFLYDLTVKLTELFGNIGIGG